MEREPNEDFDLEPIMDFEEIRQEEEKLFLQKLEDEDFYRRHPSFLKDLTFDDLLLDDDELPSK